MDERCLTCPVRSLRQPLPEGWRTAEVILFLQEEIPRAITSHNNGEPLPHLDNPPLERRQSRASRLFESLSPEHRVVLLAMCRCIVSQIDGTCTNVTEEEYADADIPVRSR